MGSGPSKEKETDVKTSRTSNSIHQAKNVETSTTKQKNDKTTVSNGRAVEPLKPYEFGLKQNIEQFDKKDRKDNKTKGRVPEPFNDSDDEGDDILKDEWKNNSKNKNGDVNRNVKTWEPPKPPEEHYPETYAQRMQREQYKNEQLLRQKTIYRNPDEWDVSDQNHTQENGTDLNASQQSFDVGKFKDANRTMPKTDIFGPLSNNDYSYRNQDTDYDNYYQQSNHNRKKSVPRYDVTEEELMADIENSYY